ncbi:exopolyphosphatase [Rhodococcus sp. Leaf7]|uniref:acyclic terpene utilization AtuA family protein n=1 Tax=unclassified Rhodococcus (in: high G+C Gram-positive bacteria) TaxID=192944 RepID=UPI0006FB9034|nr:MULTISPECIES: acyclic terpene utilization AtuA family protein [unclassified Rhodococcus (in: high G+C Gram-positive bacteria)]KQU04083.1 exopolyphosphatase [Rhodococcus sp. Leaf7]KQU40268.1 exopolyphosphatase [Rhodococcus sp. Leaf247]
MTDVIRVGNCSGFYGDRLSAMREMLDGGDLDYLTGDYLAELTMLILGRDRMKDPAKGYAKTYLRQLEDCLGTAIDKGVTLVSNAGGLAPAHLAAEIRALAERLGLEVSVAHVEGDDLHARADELGLGSPLTANAYLGAFGIARCLDSGAQVVVTGRVTDASVVVAPAISRFGWGREDLDPLAGAVVAGHVIECGTQATGGNYSFFTEITDLRHPGFPIAEIHADGSSVITKHEGTGGAVSIGTVTAQLMYEVTGPRYLGPDVTARLDTVRLSDDAPDRVRITGVRGEAPPSTLKVSRNTLGGFRNEMTFVVTGLDIEAKAELVRGQMTAAMTAPPRDVEWTLARTDHADADTEEAASALLRVVVRDSDPKKVGRAFSSAAVELALASYPGFCVTAPPAEGSPYGVFEAGYVDQAVPQHVAVLADGTRVDIDPPSVTVEPAPEESVTTEPVEPIGEPTRDLPLGTLAAARSGDKGGNANVGVWVRTDAEWEWLRATLTDDRIVDLLPEAAAWTVRRYEFPHLRAVNIVIEGILGEGVASGARFDPQAKGLGEWLRSRHVPIPESLLPVSDRAERGIA